jgi:hypothetical protein
MASGGTEHNKHEYVSGCLHFHHGCTDWPLNSVHKDPFLSFHTNPHGQFVLLLECTVCALHKLCWIMYDFGALVYHLTQGFTRLPTWHPNIGLINNSRSDSYKNSVYVRYLSSSAIM